LNASFVFHHPGTRRPSLSDVDANTKDRRSTVWVINTPSEIGVFVRSSRELRRVRNAVKEGSIPTLELSDNIEVTPGKLSIGTMHLAKGLEFRAVAVMACDDEVIPSQERIENVADDADLEEVYDSERHLLYVARTRARDHLLVTGVKPASEFLDDLPN
jgi:superfamily I DNA/RNA helicase